MKRIIVSAALLTLAPLAAHAGDVKSYPGYACLTHESPGGVLDWVGWWILGKEIGG